MSRVEVYIDSSEEVCSSNLDLLEENLDEKLVDLVLELVFEEVWLEICEIG